MTNATPADGIISPISKSDLTDEQATFLRRFDLTEGSDGLLQVETRDDDATARQLLNLGLIAYINAVYIFAQLTPEGVIMVQNLNEEI